MELRFAPLFSGSSGNCTYVGNDDGAILIDAGVSGKKILQALEEIGADPASIRGILVTHEHSDHIKSIGVLARKLDVPVYATEATWDAMPKSVGEISGRNRYIIEPEVDFRVAGMEIIPFSTPHDAADSVGYSIGLGMSRFTLATDIGCIRDGWMNHARGSDAVLLESNYDPNMLEVGPYPYDLKKRIASRKGHLSNDDSAKAALELTNFGTKQLILGHLSKENNFPDLALRTSELFLGANGVELDRDVRLTVAERDCVTGLYGIRADLVLRHR